MNNQSVLGKVVNELTRPQPSNTSGRANRRPNKKSRSRGNGVGRPGGGVRGMQSRNPGPGRPDRRDNMLNLTGTQFTATSPLNLFETRPASTPGGIIVRGRELINATVSPVGGTTGSFTPLTIGANAFVNIIPSSFPRLNSYTNIYEHYIFHKCAILFLPNQPTTASGEIILSVDYDAKDTAPASVIAQMRNISSTMANIYSKASLEMLKSLSRLPRYCTSQASGPDVNQLNQGVLYVSVDGVTATAGTGLGYIVIQYEVEFFTPQ